MVAMDIIKFKSGTRYQFRQIRWILMCRFTVKIVLTDNAVQTGYTVFGLAPSLGLAPPLGV